MLPAVYFCALAATVEPAMAGGWAFSWSDEFDGSEVDPAVWGYETGYVRSVSSEHFIIRTNVKRCAHNTQK